jgi:tRNA G37 N-methylase TrmD
MVIVDSVIRHVPGVPGGPASLEEESHGEEGLCNYAPITDSLSFHPDWLC